MAFSLDGLFGARKAPTKRFPPDTSGGSVQYQPDALSQRFEGLRKQGGGIVSNAHPEYEKPAPLDQMGDFFNKLFTGGKKGQ